MDTSEKYIKMCDCPEIQEKHLFVKGDYYIRKGLPDSLGIFITDWNINQKQQLLNLAIPFLWLPRQDELQRMLEEKALKYQFGKIVWFITRIDDFAHYIITNVPESSILWSSSGSPL